MRTPDRERCWGGPHDGARVVDTLGPRLGGSGPPLALARCLPWYDAAGALIVRPLGSAERYERDASGLWRWRGTFVPADGQAA